MMESTVGWGIYITVAGFSGFYISKSRTVKVGRAGRAGRVGWHCGFECVGMYVCVLRKAEEVGEVEEVRRGCGMGWCSMRIFHFSFWVFFGTFGDMAHKVGSHCT